MAGPLEGVRVIDIGFWVAGPAAAGILADWGAEVIKIEPPDGDPFRGVYIVAGGVEVPINPAFELDNRGKRSIALNLLSEEGRRDRPAAGRTRRRAGLQPAAAGRWSGSASTTRALQGSQPARWSTAASAVTAPSAPIATARPTTSAPSGRAPASRLPDPAGSRAAAAARRHGRPHHRAVGAPGRSAPRSCARQRTGEGQFVSTSLLRTGVYVLGWDVNTRLRFGRLEAALHAARRAEPTRQLLPQPGRRWFWLLGLQGDRHWPDLLRAIERPELLTDPRFRDIRVRRRNNAACVEDAGRGLWQPRPWPLGEGASTRRACGGRRCRRSRRWSTTRRRARRAPSFSPRSPEGEAEMVASPVDFGSTPWRARRHVPRARPAHRGDPPRARLRLGADRGAEGSRRHPLRPGRLASG